MIIARIHTTTFDPDKKASTWKETELEELNEEGLREVGARVAAEGDDLSRADAVGARLEGDERVHQRVAHR